MVGYGIRSDEEVRFILEAEHVHSSSQEYAQQFEELVKHEVRFPGNNQKETYLPPDIVDEDVLNMDDTIPNE